MKEPESFEIPEECQKLVMERFENARKNPKSLVDWEEAKKILNVKWCNWIMENLVIKNKGNQMIIKLNKKGFDQNYLISLVKRLQTEELAQRSGFTSNILDVAEQINQEWWDKNGEIFLEGIKR